MGSELRGVALMNLGIVETWSGRFDDAERHLAEGAALARSIGRPYLEVACRAHQGFASRTVSLAGSITLRSRSSRRDCGRSRSSPGACSRTSDCRLAATQARLGMLDEARATLTGLPAEDELVGDTARAVICIAEGDPRSALDLLQDVLDVPTPAGLPAFALVEAQLLAGIAHLDRASDTRPPPRPRRHSRPPAIR